MQATVSVFGTTPAGGMKSNSQHVFPDNTGLGQQIVTLLQSKGVVTVGNQQIVIVVSDSSRGPDA